MNIQELMADPQVRMAAGGVVVLVVVALLVRSGKRRGRKATVDAAARARQKLLAEVRGFRDDLKKVVAASGPVFKKMGDESSQGMAIGHWRKTLRHRIVVRSLDFGSVKAAARSLGLDSMPVSDLEAAWRKMERQIGDYNAGKLDDSPTPIATVRQFDKDLQKMVVLVNIALTALEK